MSIPGTAGPPCPGERRLAALVCTVAMLGASEVSLAQGPLFDIFAVGHTYQPAFLRLQTESGAPSLGLLPEGSTNGHADSSWLDPSPLSGTAVATFKLMDQPTATGSVVTVPVCPDPGASALAPIAPTPDAGHASSEQLLGRGKAVWYELSGQTANGEIYDPDGFTAGHRTLPFGTKVRVVNHENGRSTVVRINDRGPKQAKFEIDLSRGSAKFLGISGTATVSLYAVEEPGHLQGSIVQSTR